MSAFHQCSFQTLCKPILQEWHRRGHKRSIGAFHHNMVQLTSDELHLRSLGKPSRHLASSAGRPPVIHLKKYIQNFTIGVRIWVSTRETPVGDSAGADRCVCLRHGHLFQKAMGEYQALSSFPSEKAYLGARGWDLGPIPRLSRSVWYPAGSHVIA